MYTDSLLSPVSSSCQHLQNYVQLYMLCLLLHVQQLLLAKLLLSSYFYLSYYSLDSADCLIDGLRYTCVFAFVGVRAARNRGIGILHDRGLSAVTPHITTYEELTR